MHILMEIRAINERTSSLNSFLVPKSGLIGFAGLIAAEMRHQCWLARELASCKQTSVRSEGGFVICTRCTKPTELCIVADGANTLSAILPRSRLGGIRVSVQTPISRMNVSAGAFYASTYIERERERVSTDNYYGREQSNGCAKHSRTHSEFSSDRFSRFLSKSLREFLTIDPETKKNNPKFGVM